MNSAKYSKVPGQKMQDLARASRASLLAFTKYLSMRKSFEKEVVNKQERHISHFVISFPPVSNLLQVAPSERQNAPELFRSEATYQLKASANQLISAFCYSLAWIPR
jgi:hypothetical protein